MPHPQALAKMALGAERLWTRRVRRRFGNRVRHPIMRSPFGGGDAGQASTSQERPIGGSRRAEKGKPVRIRREPVTVTEEPWARSTEAQALGRSPAAMIRSQETCLSGTNDPLRG